MEFTSTTFLKVSKINIDPENHSSLTLNFSRKSQPIYDSIFAPKWAKLDSIVILNFLAQKVEINYEVDVNCEGRSILRILGNLEC